MDRPLGFGLWESRRISLQKKKNTQATICALELHTRRKQKCQNMQRMYLVISEYVTRKIKLRILF